MPDDAPWNPCDEGLTPLAMNLNQIARRMGISYDADRAARLGAAYTSDKEPADAREIDHALVRYHFDSCINWLKARVSVDFAEDLRSNVLAVKQRFHQLELKACKLLSSEHGSLETNWVRNSIPQLTARHYDRLRELFPEHEHYPERSEMPEELAAFESEFLDEYTSIQSDLQRVASHLRDAAATVRGIKPGGQQGVGAGPETLPDGTPFTVLQIKIMKALDGQGLTKESLAFEVSDGDSSRFFRAGGLKELQAAGFVKNKRGVGYYRVDKPPILDD